MKVYKAKRKDLFIYTKDGQDFGPFTIKELLDVALEGDLEFDTPVRTLKGGWSGTAREIEGIAEQIKKFKAIQKRKEEEAQVEREVEHIKKVHKRNYWIPVVIGVLVLGALGGGFYFVYNENGSSGGSDFTLIFKEISLKTLTPIDELKAGQRVAKKQHKVKSKRKRIHLKIIHTWNGVISIDFSKGSGDKIATAAQLKKFSDRIEGIVKRCGAVEHKINKRFKDAIVSVNAIGGNKPQLSRVVSKSGVSTRFISCVKRSLNRLTVPSGLSRMLSVPLKVY